MNDTTPRAAAQYHAMLMRRSGAERLKMCSSMFQTARTLMIARLKEEGVAEEDMKVALFLRTYGDQFTEEQKARICTRIRAAQKK
jgi:hypothetical protein